MTQRTIVWARWRYSDGLGRWHVVTNCRIGRGDELGALGVSIDPTDMDDLRILIFDPVLDEAGHRIVLLVCGRTRHELPAKAGIEHPPRAECCPECLTFDDMRERYVPEKAVEPLLVPVTAGGPSAVEWGWDDGA